jgi:alcohol dehydrogenase YqhD (iron-dependent ADH family)
MEILKYWHKEKASAQGPKGRTYDLTCWGGSSQSIDDAKEKAVKKLHRWIQSIGGGEKLAEYEYASANSEKNSSKRSSESKATLSARSHATGTARLS